MERMERIDRGRTRSTAVSSSRRPTSSKSNPSYKENREYREYRENREEKENKRTKNPSRQEQGREYRQRPSSPLPARSDPQRRPSPGPRPVSPARVAHRQLNVPMPTTPEDGFWTSLFLGCKDLPFKNENDAILWRYRYIGVLSETLLPNDTIKGFISQYIRGDKTRLWPFHLSNLNNMLSYYVWRMNNVIRKLLKRPMFKMEEYEELYGVSLRWAFEHEAQILQTMQLSMNARANATRALPSPKR